MRAEPLNVIFAGNFLYPVGMANTKRVQHFIDAVVGDSANSARVLLFRQGHAGRDDSHLSGTHQGVPFVTIGADIGANWRLPWSLLKYLYAGTRLIWKGARKDARNILYIYSDISIENLPFVLLARLRGFRIVVDIVEDRYLIDASAPFLSRIKARSADAVTQRIAWFVDGMVVISRYLEQKFSLIGGGKLPICMIPVSVDTSRITPSEEAFHDPVRVMYAGTFGEKDGVEDLIAAFSELGKRHQNLELLMTGKAMEGRMSLIRRAIEGSPCRARIRYLGFLSDAEYYGAIRDGDILCVTRTHSEFADRGFPFKLGEFLATGRPVVASATGDIPSYLCDGRDAMLVEPGSAASIVSAIERLLSSPAEALLIGRRGREIAERHFDTKGHAITFLRLLANL